MSLVTSSTYKPMVGVSSSTDTRGQITSYDYDALNRLVNIKQDGNVLQNFKYGYGLGTAPVTSPQSLFYNALTQVNYSKQGCPAGMHGEVVPYIVPYGKHASSLNVPDANSKATSELETKGQNNANAVGKCYWHNALKNQYVFKNDCLPEEGPPIAVMYTVAAGKHKSLISQVDADAMATAEITAMGQGYANTYGSCSCVGQGKKWINGFCETGTMVVVGGIYTNGQWECSFYYVFSDNSTSGYYYIYQPFPCPIAP